MWKQALTNDEVLGRCLMQWVGNRGWSIVYPHAGREVAVVLEGPIIFAERCVRDNGQGLGARCDESAPDKPLVSGAMPFAVFAKLF